MPKTDVVISWSFASVPQAVRGAFQRPTTFVAIPTPTGRKYGQQLASFFPSPIRGILKKYAPGVEPLRIAALGFSESCQGVGALLGGIDGNVIDSAVAIDGIHTAPGKQVPADGLKAWRSFATLAAQGGRLCVITHSSIQPPYASTTATANFIWEHATRTKDYVTIPAVPLLQGAPSGMGGQATTVNVGSPPANKPYPVVYPDVMGHMIAPRRANGLVVLGWNNLDVPAGYADHIWQARVVLPLMIEKFLVPRWNAIDPSDPAATCFVGEAGARTYVDFAKNVLQSTLRGAACVATEDVEPMWPRECIERDCK